MGLPSLKRVHDVPPEPLRIHGGRIDQQNQIDQILDPRVWPLAAWQRVGMDFLRKMLLTRNRWKPACGDSGKPQPVPWFGLLTRLALDVAHPDIQVKPREQPTIQAALHRMA